MAPGVPLAPLLPHWDGASRCPSDVRLRDRLLAWEAEGAAETEGEAGTEHAAKGGDDYREQTESHGCRRGREVEWRRAAHACAATARTQGLSSSGGRLSTNPAQAALRASMTRARSFERCAAPCRSRRPGVLGEETLITR